MYDIIGDIHGKADMLFSLLDQLNYQQKVGVFRHPERKAVFLGDFINKGTQNWEVLQAVRAMVTAGNAMAVLGNHELNLIGFFCRHKEGNYIRPHSDKNRQQHEPTFESFGDDTASLKEYIGWLRQLPLFIETERFRVAHAFWHRASVDYLKKNFPQNCLDDQQIKEMTPESKVFQAIQEVVVGLKLNLPEEQGGEAFKAKWWNVGKSDTYDDLAIRSDSALGNPFISTQDISLDSYQYPEDDKPFFFGHYNLPGKPILLAHNYTCLDFNTDEHPLIVAYRWDGEQILDSRKLMWV